MKRIDLTSGEIAIALKRLRGEVNRRLGQKGRGAFASSHEILGVLDEEYAEYLEAVHDNLDPNKRMDELYDIAVACIIGAASIGAGHTDW